LIHFQAVEVAVVVQAEAVAVLQGKS